MTNRQTTLRDRYKQKQRLEITREKIVRLDETRRQKLNEEIDQRLLKTVVDTVKRLNSVNFGSMSILDSARDAAVLDVTRAATGDQKKGILNRIASMFRGNDSPVFDALAFGSAISNFFPQLANYADALASKNGGQAGDDVDLVTLAKDQEHLDAIKSLITKGLRPNGVLAKMGAGWAKKYLKGSLDDLAEQIIQTSVGEIKQVASSVKQATTQVNQVAQVAQQRSQDVQQQQAAPGAEPDKIQNAYAKIKDKIGDLDDSKRQTVADVLKALAGHDLLK